MAHVIIGTTTASTGTGLVVTSIVVGGTPPAPTSAQFAKNLALGARGDEVKALQQSLVAKGYLAGNLPMGYFGPLTKAAVMKFQKENSLPSTGFVGPMTRAVLNK